MILQIDFAILDFVQKHFRSEVCDEIMKFVTALGNYGAFYIVTTLILLIYAKTRTAGTKLAIAQITGAIICSVILKNVVGRIRPFNIRDFDLLINAPKDFSFPSGHTLHAFVCASVIYTANRKWGIAAYILAFVMGFSRIYLYVHYPSDVLTGAVLGVAIGYGVSKAFDYYKKRKAN